MAADIEFKASVVIKEVVVNVQNIAAIPLCNLYSRQFATFINSTPYHLNLA